MNQHAKKRSAAPPEAIYIIRHGEKPADPEPSGHGKPADAPFGVDLEGKQSLPARCHPLGTRECGLCLPSRSTPNGASGDFPCLDGSGSAGFSPCRMM